MLIFAALPFWGFGQKDTTWFFGVNGKVSGVEKHDIKKEIDYRSGNKIRVETYKADENDWRLLYTEKIKVANDSTYEIKMRGDEFSGRFTRSFEQLQNGKFRFTDWLDHQIKRQGITRKKLPLLFDGEVTEFYPFGRIKSVSQYKNNRLQGNQNWLPTGKPVVDDVFYSVDREPRFEPGMGKLHQHLMQALKEAQFDLQSVEGRMVIGFVVTKAGETEGFRIIQGISDVLNGIIVTAIQTMEGEWIPAQLDGRAVNYLQLIPINFIYNTYDFDYLQLKGGALYWEIN